MPMAAIPPDEDRRLESLYRYELIDTLPEESFDQICRLAAEICQTPIALITLLDRNRQYFKAAVGIQVRQTDRDTSFCAHAILGDETLVIEDAQKDDRINDMSLVVGKPWIRFYAGEPIRAADGAKLGTLCVIDRVPRTMSEAQLDALRLLARGVELHFELRRTNAELARQMAERQRVAQSVVHDMSDPLTAIEFALAELRELSSPDSDPIPHAVTSRLANEIGSGAYSLRRLVLNLRDIGVGEDGALAPRWQLTALVPVARNVVELARPAARRRTLTLELASDGEDISVRCDPDLVRRILENLVFNAVDYAPPSSTIRMHLRDLGHSVEVRVEDEGEGISPAERERIFDLYGRGHQPGHRISRGIGLAFCRTAARAQGGDVDVERREPQGSVFVFRLPHR